MLNFFLRIIFVKHFYFFNPLMYEKSNYIAIFDEKIVAFQQFEKKTMPASVVVVGHGNNDQLPHVTFAQTKFII